MSKLLTQGYDGCSSMAGKEGGLQVKIQNLYPKAHCTSHTLNLVVNDLNPVAQVRNPTDTHDLSLDILALQETWISADAPPAINDDIAPSGYSCLHVCRADFILIIRYVMFLTCRIVNNITIFNVQCSQQFTISEHRLGAAF